MAHEPATDLERRLAQAQRALSEALERQAANDEVLRVISSSPGELKPLFKAMLANAVRICEATIGTLYLREGDVFRTVAIQNAPPAYVEARTRELIPPPPSLGRLLATKQVVQIADVKRYRPTSKAIPLSLRPSISAAIGRHSRFSWAEQERRLFWQVSGEIGLALIGADSEVLFQSPEQIAEVSAEPPEYLLLRSPDLGPRSSVAENS
jgi:hypothetical protein